MKYDSSPGSSPVRVGAPAFRPATSANCSVCFAVIPDSMRNFGAEPIPHAPPPKPPWQIRCEHRHCMATSLRASDSLSYSQNLLPATTFARTWYKAGETPRKLLNSIKSTRPRRLARPRTSPFHGGNTGSNPVGDANISSTSTIPLFSFMFQYGPVSTTNAPGFGLSGLH